MTTDVRGGDVKRVASMAGEGSIAAAFVHLCRGEGDGDAQLR